MISFLRRMINSGLGVFLAIALVVLLGLGFAAQDIFSNQMGSGSGSDGGSQIASVGKRTISATQLSQAANNDLESAKQQDPRLTMKAFVAGGGLERSLKLLLDRAALGVFGREHGIIASERLIDSEITKIAAFKGPDGKFSETVFKQALQQRGFNEKTIREDLAQGLTGRQLVVPAGFAAVAPREMVLRYAALLLERRSGSIAMVPSAAFAPKEPPSDADLQAWYNKNRDRFLRPERRTIRYATFGEDALKNVPAPTDAEIAARYNANKAQYAALETRRMTQLVVPTQAAAEAVVAEVASGKSLETAAASKGLSTSKLASLSQQALSTQSSQAVAQAAFAAASGKIAPPAKSALGWHVLRIDGIDRRAERTLDQARAELLQQLTVEKRRAAINDLSAKIEDEFDSGGNLSETAQEMGLVLKETPPLTADGQIYGATGKTAPPELVRAVQTAFAMERENQPQLAEVVAGKTFLIFDVTKIVPSAPAPLAEIRDEVVTGLTLERGTAAAKAAAEKVAGEARRGTSLNAALASLGKPMPPVQAVDMARQQLPQDKRQIPPPVTLLFSMAKGTVKLLAAPNDRGWYVVQVKDIVPGKIEPNDPALANVQSDFASLAGEEYQQLLIRAISAEVGVKKNETAIKAVRTQLGGGS
ncbi:MAG: peptidyl-prolyl cis-trans isomerase [Novosphingobium sp.]